MACFLVPVAEAIVVSVIAKVSKSRDGKSQAIRAKDGNKSLETNTKIPFYKKLKWLTNMLGGGSALLAFEHFWHGEVVPWFPFLTAAANPAEASAMLHEMATVGVAMAALVTAVWGAVLLVTNAMEKKALKAEQPTN